MSDDRYFSVKCPACSWAGSSKDAAGGGAIADTGDYEDLVCPACLKEDRWVVLDYLD